MKGGMRVFVDRAILKVFETEKIFLPQKEHPYTYTVNGQICRTEEGRMEGYATILAKDKENWKNTRILSYHAKGFVEIKLGSLESLAPEHDALQTLYEKRLKAAVTWDDEDRGHLYLSSPRIKKVYEVSLLGDQPLEMHEVSGVDYRHFHLLHAYATHEKIARRTTPPHTF